MSIYQITATSLNMRTTPKASGSNKIAVLPQGQEVEKLDELHHPWWHIKTTLSEQIIEGYVHSKYLTKKTEAPVPIQSNTIAKVHLSENRQDIKRNKDRGRAYPLGETDRPTRSAMDRDGKVKEIAKIIQWLKVNNSKRYLRKGSTTYCNIYAYDYCYLTAAYLPRVWWTQQAIIKLSQGINVPVLYNKSVTQLNANSLHDWFIDFGSDFGWKRTFSVDDAQQAANKGKVVIACAKRVSTNRPGHICAIVPETNDFKAIYKSNGSISKPLQSQAGSKNYQYKAARKWWTGSRFQSFGIWVHEQLLKTSIYSSVIYPIVNHQLCWRTPTV